MKTKKILMSIWFFFLVSFGFSQSKFSQKNHQWHWGESSGKIESNNIVSEVNPEVLAVLFPDTKYTPIEESYFIKSSYVYPNPLIQGKVATISIIPNESSIYKVGVYDSKGKQQIELFEGSVIKGEELQLELNSQKLDEGYSYVKIISASGYSKVIRLLIVK